MNNTSDKRRVNNNSAEQIDLLEMAGVLWNHALILIICLVVGAVAAFAGTKMFITPMYQSSATIYIFSSTTSITSLTDIQIGNSLTADFTILATTREVVNNVIDELDLDTTYNDLVENISITNPDESHMLKVTVTDADPEEAAEIANTLADELRDQIADIMNTSRPSIAERAIVPTEPSSPSTLKNTAEGGIILFVIAAAIIVVRWLLDDTIKTEDDVEKYLGLQVLAAIPKDKAREKAESRNQRKGRSKK